MTRGEVSERLDPAYVWQTAQESSLRYPLIMLDDLATDVFQGVMLKLGSADDPIGLRVRNLRGDQGIDFDDADTTSGVAPRKILQPGDLLTPFIGEAIRQLNFSVFEGFHRPCTVDGNTGVIRLQTELARPQFVAAWFTSELGSAELKRFIGGGGTPFLGAANAKQLRVPRLTVDEQDRLLANLNAARAARDAEMAEADGLIAGIDAFLLDTLGLTMPSPRDPTQPFAVRLRRMAEDGRLLPGYFQPERSRAIEAIEAGGSHQLLGALIEHRRAPRAIAADDFYVGLARVASHAGELTDIEETVEGAVLEFERGDLLYARLRPYLNKVWVADRGGVCSPEFYVVRTTGEASVEYLAALLRSRLTLAQTRHVVTGNTHPRVAQDDFDAIVLPLGDAAKRADIAAEASRRRVEARRLRAEARDGWEAARRRFEDALLEPAA